MSKTLAELIEENAAFRKMRADAGIANASIELQASITTLGGATGGAVPYEVRTSPVLPRPRRLTVRDLLAPGTTSASLVTYPQETGFANNAAVVSEGESKPESAIVIEDENAPVRTIAHLVNTSSALFEDSPALRSYASARLLAGLTLVEEEQLLMGDGTGMNLRGLVTWAEAYDDTGQIGVTMWHVLRHAMRQVEIAEFAASGIVINPTDAEKLDLLADTTGQFIRPDWAPPIVSTPAMTEGDFLVGAFADAAQIFDRQQASVLISREHSDNFERNRVTILGEQRLALACYRPEAFVVGSFE